MQPKTHKLLEMCVEAGVAYGYRRAHKHDDRPDEEQVKAAICAAVMTEIWEWFDQDPDDFLTDEEREYLWISGQTEPPNMPICCCDAYQRQIKGE